MFLWCSLYSNVTLWMSHNLTTTSWRDWQVSDIWWQSRHFFLASNKDIHEQQSCKWNSLDSSLISMHVFTAHNHGFKKQKHSHYYSLYVQGCSFVSLGHLWCYPSKDHLQILIFLSSDPDTMICSEGWTSQLNTGRVCPVNFLTTWQVLRSHI